MIQKCWFPLALLLTAGLAGCFHDKADQLYPAPLTCDTANVTFSGTIRPIISQNCAIPGCHTGTTPAGNVNLETYAGVQATVSTGQLHGVINHLGTYSPMPKNRSEKLPDCNLAQIEKWIAGGALNN